MSQQGGGFIAPTDGTAPSAPIDNRLSALVPDGWADQIEAYHRGEFTAVPPRHAATVVLLRDDPVTGPDVYLLKRAATMAFGGFYAFPGGRVDPRDADAEIAWTGPPAADWAERFGSDEAAARALLCAAVRETFEESGVLFAGPDEHSVVADTTGDDWERDRQALVSRETSLAEFLAARSLVLRTDLLGAWAHWITPEFEPKRFDTGFFVAALPAGQLTRDVSGESETTLWLSPRQAIADHLAGRVRMLPPTITTLRQLLDYDTAGAAVRAAAERALKPIMPTVAQEPDGSWHLVWDL